jgi:SAM-dependent methyltransferase
MLGPRWGGRTLVSSGVGQLAGHPDRVRWNARYGRGFTASFDPHPLAVRALSMRLPVGPVLELACGPSGSALLAATAGRRVVAVDVSDVALALLAGQARRRGLGSMIELVDADLVRYRPAHARYALVLCTGYWDRAVFTEAAAAVAERGLIGWEAFSTDALRAHPGMPPEWCLQPGEPACLLPPGFEVLSQQDLNAGGKRQLLARRSRESRR